MVFIPQGWSRILSGFSHFSRAERHNSKIFHVTFWYMAHETHGQKTSIKLLLPARVLRSKVQKKSAAHWIYRRKKRIKLIYQCCVAELLEHLLPPQFFYNTREFCNLGFTSILPVLIFSPQYKYKEYSYVFYSLSRLLYCMG